MQIFNKKNVKNKYGKIINITSIVGHTGNLGQANYSASKAGIVLFQKLSHRICKKKHKYKLCSSWIYSN